MAETDPSAKWQQFRKSRLGLIFGLVLASLLSLVIILFVGFVICLPAILVAMIMYFVPKYFGLVSRKKLIAFGLVLMLFLGLASGFTLYFIIKDLQPETVSSGDGIMTQGSVSPFRGTEALSYNFTVVVQGAEASSEVWAYVYDYFAGNEATRINLTHSYNLTSDTRLFYQEQQLPSSTYRFNFYYNQSAGSEIKTSAWWGPIMTPDGEVLNRELYYNVLYVFLNVGLWFVFMVILTWWLESSKKRMQDLQAAKKEGAKPSSKAKQDKFVCSECGADVPGDAEECPQCGERFDDETQSQKCPSCGKEVNRGASSCWNCGKELRK